MSMRSILALSLLALAWSSLALGDVTVESPWVREAPPHAEALAAYMVLKNSNSTVEVLQKVTSPAFKQVEIHQTSIHNGTASMEAQDSLSIPANGKVSLAPNGHHLMLIGAAHPLKVGDTVDLFLHFQGGKTVEVHAPVRKDAETTTTTKLSDEHHHAD